MFSYVQCVHNEKSRAQGAISNADDTRARLN